MNKKNLSSIVIILFIILGVGYYLGLRFQTVKVTVHEVDPAGIEIGTRTIELSGNQLSNGVLTDLFGKNIIYEGQNIPWYVTRASAICAYLLMFLIVIWGTGMTTGVIYQYIQPTAAWGIHKFLSIAMSTLVFFHMGALLFDHYINFGMKDLFIPFVANFKPLYVGLGVISFYILLVIMITSIFFKNKSERVWHLIHLSVYPLFALALFHGLFTGTDSKTFVMTIIYRVTGVIFAANTIYRFTLYYLKQKIKSAA
jgi:DMSO/TMAO reductase YedYZ heme-binding membrane subunit